MSSWNAATGHAQKHQSSLDAFFERVVLKAATIDELLSDEFTSLPGQKGDADLAARRLAAWCNSCASGDWLLFKRRLERDGLSIFSVLEKFATARRSSRSSTPAWVDDAIWIERTLQSQHGELDAAPTNLSAPSPFQELFIPVVAEAASRLWAGVDSRVTNNLSQSARGCLSQTLLKTLCHLASPALYERFRRTRQYQSFIADMKGGGFRRLFEEKPVLLRLIASVARQWINTSGELVLRLDSDLETIRRDLLRVGSYNQVVKIEGGLSDLHNEGRSVQIISFEDKSKIVYKPKDLRADAAWYGLVERLNRALPPIELTAARAVPKVGYGWVEFIDHEECPDEEGRKRFFRRAGAWLALFHAFAGADMHQENIIAAGDHPIPIDLEMILQSTLEERKSRDLESLALEAAKEVVANSVMMVGLLPAYGRSPDNEIFAIGGMAADATKAKLVWDDINSDKMRPRKAKEAGAVTPNLPHFSGMYAKFGDYIEDFAVGFQDYARFLGRQNQVMGADGLFEGFVALPVRKVIRPTRFYYLLLERLRNHRCMDDGAVWSSHADFIARLADWEKDLDELWPLQRSERLALLNLNVPHFLSVTDENEIVDAAGVLVQTEAVSGMERARTRVQRLNEEEINWQLDVIRQNTTLVPRSEKTTFDRKPQQLLCLGVSASPTNQYFAKQADKVAESLSSCAIRRGHGAAWIGLDWLGDSEVVQLVSLGPDLYNGNSGIALFLAAHAAVTGSKSSEELAFAAIAHVRKSLRSRNAPRLARSLGTGAATGLGSIVYALTVMAKCLRNEELLGDAHAAAALFTDDVIGADKHLDVLGGAAGGILSLLRLYRDSGSGDVLKRATKCGEYLLAQRRAGSNGRLSWTGQAIKARPLNGMSHGAAGFAYALASLSAATGRREFRQAASECIAFENASYDPQRMNWPDLRTDGEPIWSCQWCHGAPGIGLGRIAMYKQAKRETNESSELDSDLMMIDIRSALLAAERDWPSHVDTLCCGTLGSIEFVREAGGVLENYDDCERASRQLMAVLETAASVGDFRWNAGRKRFNLGLFRGLAGIGYTCLRQIDSSLPNLLIWQ